ncbi:hypothetical protein [Rhizobium azibense]|uniref:Uncharacterized protein n=1 Tax=Rhizobium azibense TaxID=1136135 RepID=A0A4R3RI10_9HYPH|nr:hypothetical protein [Rhizobium azibense]TCU33142.1 hypothetical protein EV129_117139 [Rhizobium azibense]
MKDLVEILKALAWPGTVVIIFFYLRNQATFAAAALIRKIGHADKVKLRLPGVAFEMASQVARTSITPTKKSREGETDAAEFERLAREYTELSIPDKKERAAKRFELADRLGELAVSLNLPRSSLARGNEGEIVALATAAILEPMAHDLRNMRTAAAKGEFKFTAYRLVLTIPALASDARPATIARLEAMLNDIETRSKSREDDDLQELVETTRLALADLQI